MQNNSGQLAGKVVLISGGAGGLGAAFARHILARGGSVVLADLLDDEGSQLVRELGPQARYTHLDVTDPEQWSSAVQYTLDEFGSLNGLVNNAGVSTGQFLEHEPLAHFRMVLEINLVGVFNGLQAVIKPMRSAGGGVADQGVTMRHDKLAAHGAAMPEKMAPGRRIEVKGQTGGSLPRGRCAVGDADNRNRKTPGRACLFPKLLF